VSNHAPFFSGCGVKIFAADTTVFSYAISELKEIIPIAFRSYEPAKKTWMITDWELTTI
jgi:hypothetical protein